MKTRKVRASSRKAPKECHSLKSGPWAGRCIWLDSYGGGNTGWLQVGPVAGRYMNGEWQELGGHYHHGKWINPSACE